MLDNMQREIEHFIAQREMCRPMFYKDRLYTLSFRESQSQDAERVKSGIDYDMVNRLLLNSDPKTFAFSIVFRERKPAAK